MKTRILFAGAMAATLAVAATPVAAQDVRYLAANCANCHGTDGRAAEGGGMPALAGLSRAYLIEQINAMRSGARESTIMHQLSKGYTDAQISALADYFSQQKPNR